MALGAILSQQAEYKREHPVAYASRTLQKAEKNYSTIEREALAIVWGIKHYRPYLYGRHFVLYTDHEPLKWLMSQREPSGGLARWSLKLQEYDFEIKYKPGRNNSNVDALSRVVRVAAATTDHPAGDLQAKQRGDHKLLSIINYLTSEEVPPEQRLERWIRKHAKEFLMEDGLLYHVVDAPSNTR